MWLNNISNKSVVFFVGRKLSFFDGRDNYYLYFKRALKLQQHYFVYIHKSKLYRLNCWYLGKRVNNKLFSDRENFT